MSGPTSGRFDIWPPGPWRDIKLDARGRCLLGKEFAGRRYLVRRDAFGTITLTPVQSVPAGPLPPTVVSPNENAKEQ